MRERERERERKREGALWREGRNEFVVGLNGGRQRGLTDEIGRASCRERVLMSV